MTPLNLSSANGIDAEGRGGGRSSAYLQNGRRDFDREKAFLLSLSLSSFIKAETFGGQIHSRFPLVLPSTL